MARHRPVTRIWFAKLCGRTKQAITEACNRGSLREACIGRKVDLDHPKAIAYAKRCGAKIPPRAQAKPKARPKPKKPVKKLARGRPKAKSLRKKSAPKAPASSPKPAEKPSPEPDPRIPPGMIPPGLETIDVDRFASMTMEQIARDFGTWDQFINVVDAVKKLAAIREKDDKHRQFEGSVISRELVATHIFSYLEKLHRRLLSPVPKTVVRKAIAGVKAGEAAEKLEKKAKELMGAELSAARDSVARTLRKA